MSQSKARIGIYLRVVAAAMSLLVLMALLLQAGFALILKPPLEHERSAFSAWIVEHATLSIDDGAALTHDLEETRARIHADITVYDPTGVKLASNVTPPLELPPSARKRILDGASTVSLGPDRFGVRLDRGGVLRGIAVTNHEPPRIPSTEVALLILASFVVTALASVPLARSMVRPLVALERATSMLGEGDLKARVVIDRTDEIGDLGRAFNDMAARIAAFMRSEKELLANVSHELRTPLARIRVVLDLASEGDPARISRYLAEIAQDLSELERLLDDVLTTAKLDLAEQRAGAGSAIVPMRSEPVSLEDLLSRSKDRFLGLYPDRSLTLHVEDDLPILKGDQNMLRRAVDNLVDNAVKHAPAETAIEIVAKAKSFVLTIEVVDHGPGMPKHVAERAFEPFYRGDTSRDRRTGGVGLGLSLVRRIVEAHRGTVELESEEGKGTKVRIRVPC